MSQRTPNELRAIIAEATPLPWFAQSTKGADFALITTTPTVPEAPDYYGGKFSPEDAPPDVEVLGVSEWVRIDAADLRLLVEAANALPWLLLALEGRTSS